MEKLSLCRICLSNDIPMRSIVRTPLQEVYESLTTMPFVAEDIRPVVVCNFCCVRLKNSLELKEKCLQSEKLFLELLQSNVQVNLQVMPDVHLSAEGVIQMTPNVFGNDEVKKENAEENAVVERASNSEWDVPLSIVKKEPDDVKTYDVAVKQDDADPYHSALGLHAECDIPLDIVKKEPDDVNTGNNTHCEHGRCAPGLAVEGPLLPFLVVKPCVSTYPSQDPTPSENLSSDDELQRERKEKHRERNRAYQRAWRQRQKDLKKKVSKEEKKEEKRKRYREYQRAYYRRTKGLKENGKNVGEKKLDNLQMKKKKLNSNEDQENVVQCSATQNLENLQLEQNQFLTQQFRIYGESHECVTPKAILHRTIDIPDDGNCLFHSLIHVLQLQISTCDLRRQLRDSPYLNSCHNPQEAYNILSSNNEYGDLDCVYLFAKIYNQNICVHHHYFNGISKSKDTRFCHFKANDTHNWIHLDLRELRFTPYFSDDEKKKEDERKQKQKNRIF